MHSLSACGYIQENCIILKENMFVLLLAYIPPLHPKLPPSSPKCKHTIHNYGSGHKFSNTVIPNSLNVWPP